MIKDNFLIKSEGGVLKKVVVCSPEYEYFDIKDKDSHNITEIAERNKAIEQHKNLVSTISNFGAEVLKIQELKDHPNSVFTRDTAVITKNGYIQLRMGLKSRIGEESWMGKFLKEKGIKCIGAVEYPSTAEGGDIILAGNIGFIGISSRTNKEGANQIRSMLTRQGFEVRISPVPRPFLHIGGAMSVINEDHILCVDKVFPPNFFLGFKTIVVPNEDFVTGNVITLGNNELIANEKSVAVIKALEKINYKVHKLNFSEFTKGTGGPSCLIMPFKRG